MSLRKPFASMVVTMVVSTIIPFVLASCSDTPTGPEDELNPGEFEGTLSFEGDVELDVPLELQGTAIHGVMEGENRYFHWITLLPHRREGLVSLNLLRVTADDELREGTFDVGIATPEMWDSEEPAEFPDEWVFLTLVRQPDGELGRIFSTGGTIDLTSEIPSDHVRGYFDVSGTGIVITDEGVTGEEVQVRFTGSYRSVDQGAPHPPF